MHRSATALVTSSERGAIFELSIPRTYVFGAQTLPYPHEVLLRAGRVAVVPDAGHDLLVTNSDGVAFTLAETLP